MSDDIQVAETNETCVILNENSLNLVERLQLGAMRVLTRYACASCDVRHKRQQQVLQPLLQPDFNPRNSVDFQMVS